MQPPRRDTTTRIRERMELVDSLGIERSYQAIAHNPHEMPLLDVRAALRPIDAITGAPPADDILNRIFSTFCTGK